MFDPFDQTFASDDPNNPSPIRMNRTWKEWFVFWFLNILILPLIATVYLAVSAAGLRLSLSLLNMKLFKLPIPGAGILRNYDGWDRLDLAMPLALLLFVAVSLLWGRIFRGLYDTTKTSIRRSHNPVLFYLIAVILGTVLFADAAIFYIGLESHTSGSWSETAKFAPAVATAVFAVVPALLAAWHADYHYNNIA